MVAEIATTAGVAIVKYQVEIIEYFVPQYSITLRALVITIDELWEKTQ